MSITESQKRWSLERSADVFKVLGNPVRLKIIENILSHQGMSVNKLWQCLDLPQSTLSNHLNLLKDAGILKKARKANEVYYCVCCKLSKQIVSTAIYGADK